MTNPLLQAELEALDEDALATKCKRNGLNRGGDKVAQINRLLSLHAYLSGDKQNNLSSLRPMAPQPVQQPLVSSHPF